MSGRKKSSFQLDEERQRQSDLLAAIAALRREIAGTQDQIRDVLKNTPTELYRHLGGADQAARQWAAKSDTPSTARGASRLGIQSPSATLVRVHSTLEAQLIEGRAVRSSLTRELSEITQRCDFLRTRVAHAAASLNGQRELVMRQLGADTITRLEQEIRNVQSVSNKNPLALELEGLEALEIEIAEALEVAEQAQEMSVSARAIAEIDKCQSVLLYMANTVTDGLRAAYSDVMSMVDNWLSHATDSSLLQQLDSNADAASLRETRKHLEAFVAEGRDAASSLQRMLSEDAPTLRARLTELVEPLDVMLRGSRALLASWLGEEEVARLDSVMAKLHLDLESDRLRQVSDSCLAFRDELESSLVFAQDMETKNERRQYLLEALQQVCVELGFRELQKPRLERENDPSSRIVLTVNTVTKGRITFHLALDSIEADSGIAGSYCLDEFDVISELLAEEYGAKTKFRITSGSPNALKQAEAKQEPTAQNSERTLERRN